MIKTIKANEARELMDKANENYHAICTRIHFAACHGKEEIFIKHLLSIDIEDTLRTDGFNIFVFHGKGHTRIRWGV